MLIAPPDAVLLAVLTALVVDALAGEPGWLYRRMPHPVVLLGRLIAALEARLWREGQSPDVRRARGRQLVAAVLAPSAVLGGLLTLLLTQGVVGALMAGVLASTLLAQRSLVDHVGAVADGLEQGLDEGRRAVSLVVGRDPEALDAAGVARAAVESAAENVSDGVTAPLFWFLLLGPLGLVAYKAVNTMDSMVGYRSERYLDFGRAAARLDDRANWLPARLTGLLLLVVMGGAPRLPLLAREALKHRSPNAGWPEAAMALSLNLRLAGPRLYPSGIVDDDWIGQGRTDLDATDIRRATSALWRLWAVVVTMVTAALAAVVVSAV